MTTTEFIPATAEGKPDYSPIDISSKEFWAKTSEEREERFRQLRETDPVSWQRPVEDAVVPDPEDPGYWALTKHADIVRVSKENETFISGQGVLFDLLPEIFLEMSQSFLAMDPPKHDKLRKLVSVAFTPRQVRRIEEKIQTAAKEIVDDVAPQGDIEFVSQCSERLPVRMFGDIFNIPEHYRKPMADAATGVVSWADPEHLAGRPADEVQVESCSTIHDIAEELVADRKKNPGEDLLTGLVQAEVDGESLETFEIGAFMVLLAVAATDTTKHTTSQTMFAFNKYPDQQQWLMADFDGRIDTAIEEFVRHASPVMTFRRTAITETELGGKTIKPGDKVVMFYPSGNRDADVFADPERFDLSRKPNPHVGFGGGGVHYCLGNQLAKSQLRAMFSQLLTRIPDFKASDPELLGTNFMRGVKRMRLQYTPEKG